MICHVSFVYLFWYSVNKPKFHVLYFYGVFLWEFLQFSNEKHLQNDVCNLDKN